MEERRRDSKGRLLHTGETQQANGRYRFKYYDCLGKDRYLYSWRLDKNDRAPEGKSYTLSLRELEKQVQADMFDHIVPRGGNLTVLELAEKYISTKTGVRPNTYAGYGTVLNLLRKDPFGSMRIDTVRIDTVRISDAKCWLIKLQKIDGKN